METFEGQPCNLDSLQDEPAPTPQLLKLFAESFIATKEKMPSCQSVCDQFISFTFYWERITNQTLPDAVKKDVLNGSPPAACQAS